ncbi:MAG: lysophospholipase [Bacteroidia bacterium]|nr:lysophospholipase [Bacteroidia bacterium]NND09620.1 alpha/beta hydrolase [Flavobacteriaceae bacterium]NNK27804.1 alpha/beta hydrolase [Flavobacteriaceae bacterium]
MTHETFTFNVYDTDLYGQLWQPDYVKAVVILLHGMGEHASRYEDLVIPKLVENDYAIVTYDNFGHGRTKGKRGHCPSYDALMQGIKSAIDVAENKFPKVPQFLYGHSMGGNLVINYALKEHPELKGVIATSPFLRLAFKPPKWKINLGKAMLKVWPSLTLPSELEVDAISRIPEEVKKYQEDALVHDKVSPMFTFPIMQRGEWAIKNIDKLTIPMFVLHGTGDRIIDHKASEEFANGSNFIHLELFENGYHELHHDLCKEEMIGSIMNWLDSHI